jgi:hypothetical protein
MSDMCFEEEVPIPNFHYRYFNCGVQVASQKHVSLFDVAKNATAHGWNEQNRVNIRLCLNDFPVQHLPITFNNMMWCGEPGYQHTAYFIHYCGDPSIQSRLVTCRGDIQKWLEDWGPL